MLKTKFFGDFEAMLLMPEQNKRHVIDAKNKTKAMLLVPEQNKSHIGDAKTK